MNGGIGSKGGKRDHKLTLLNIFRNRKKLELIDEEKNLKEEKNKPKLIIESKDLLENEEIIKPKISKVKQLHQENNQEKQVTSIKPNNIVDNLEKDITNELRIKETETTKNNIISEHKNEQPKTKTENKKTKSFDYLEKEVIHILEENIKENNYELKKLDSDIYTLKENIDKTEEDNLEELEKEIDDIIKRFSIIQKQIDKLKRAFDLDFSIENADNYLIYLIDEYKESFKNKKELSDKLEKNDKYQSILTRITELEIKKEELVEKAEERKETLGIEKDTLDRMNDDIINIEEKASEIKKLVENGEKQLEEIKIRLNETVHITERFETITSSVSHTIFELLLLMSLLKHHLSLKNNAVNAIAATIALDLIIRMCTPTTEQVLVRETDVKDYEKMITDCISDTDKLLDTIQNNITKISDIKYTFEKDYKELSRLPMYKDLIDKLDNLESDMKEKLESTKKLTRDMNLELEKNTAKVKKYGSMETA